MSGFSGDEVAEVGCSYAAALRRELDLYCAAVAKSMDAKSQEFSLGYPNSQASASSELISQASFHGDRDGASLFINSHIIDNADSQGMSANTGILKEQSGDGDDLKEITNPANVKKMRRMLSNRESARRSRRRKQIHLNDLESQVSSLTDENASLLKRLVDMTQKYKDATFDNRNLIVDLEMMRRKDAKSQESSLGYPNSQASASSELISQASFHGDRDGASLFINSHIIDNADSQGMSANTGILKEQSGDGDDLKEITNPANVKKMRRMLSNRESARRSRRRKQVHLNDLDSQVSRLTAENASLLKRLVDMTQKYEDANFDNRNLIVDLEMMRRKVYITEEAVRVTGANMLLPPTTSDMPVSSMPLTSCASDAASLAVAVQENMHPFLQQPLIHGNQFKLDLPNATISLSSREMVTMAVSLRGVASMEYLQKRIHKDSVHSGTALPLSDPEALNDGK